jgi:hypothetical protein
MVVSWDADNDLKGNKDTSGAISRTMDRTYSTVSSAKDENEPTTRAVHDEKLFPFNVLKKDQV